MARQFASNQYLTRAGAAPVSVSPISIVAWVRPDAAANQDVFQLAAGSLNLLQLSLTAAGKVSMLVSEHGVGSSFVLTTGTYATGAWNMIGGVVDGTTFKAILNAEIASDTLTARDFSGTLTTRISDGSGSTLVGRVAEVGVYAAHLTDEEWASLYAAGPPLVPSPLFVRPDAIRALWRLLEDDDDRDYVGGSHLSPVNSPTYGQHPAIIYPTAPHFTYVRAAAGIRPTGIASGEAFGTAALAQAIGPTGIPSAEAIGSHFLGSLVSPTSIVSGEAFGAPALAVHTEIEPTGIVSGEAFGGHFVGGQIIVPLAIESGEAVGGAGLTVELLRRLRPQCPVFASDRPFQGQGVSVYANTGETVQYRQIRVVGRHFRRHRRIWTKGTPTPRLPLGTDPIAKTARMASAAGTSGQTRSPAFSIPSAWAGQTVAVDVRHYRDDVENLTSNFRAIRIDLDGSLEETAEIRGTAELLTTEIRAGGIVRLRFAWKPARDGIQPALFRAQRTAGPTSPADVTADAIDGLRIYEIDTPVLDDSAPYTYRVRAESGATIVDALTGITFTADATGPPAVTQLLTDAR